MPRTEYKIGDCRELIKQLDDNSIDSIVTDPPYEWGFMGKEWDKSGIAFNAGLWKECLRVLKPGGHALIFGGDRTYHRMVCAVEDAGFEIRRCICWIYGSGFPKSLDIGKAIDKSMGFEREIIGYDEDYAKRVGKQKAHFGGYLGEKGRTGFKNPETTGVITKPSAPEAKQWDGWYTDLKPAVELILLARKTISENNIAKNVLRWGTGGLNIDDCRIKYINEEDKNSAGFWGMKKSYLTERLVNLQIKGKGTDDKSYSSNRNSNDIATPYNKDRYPSNLILDEESAKILDEQSGDSKGNNTKYSGYINKFENANFNFGNGAKERVRVISDNGGASRFFYIVKASASERYFICKVCNKVDNDRKRHKKHSMRCNDCNMDYEPQLIPNLIILANEKKKRKHRPQFLPGYGQNISPHQFKDDHKNHNIQPNLIGHPTQKPLKLIEYLVKLITPKGGIVLDPFLGSGTTLKACRLSGYDGVGFEKESDYEPIIREYAMLKEPMIESYCKS